MCDQTPVEYKNGDIVWVKLGSCWWPGEVQDVNNVPEETIAAFKKPIIAAVKFFDEDCYEFIKSIDRIYFYNCSKKNEFIKKGLDLYRGKHDYMKKFPGDVSKAEARTNGNPNIIDDPMFAPEKKTNVAALIFGNPKPKKSPKKSIGSNRKSIGSKSPASATKTPTNRIITHRRFLGHDDHEVRILVQSPEQIEQTEEEEKGLYKCLACGFSTERVDVSIMHHKSHIQGLFFTSPSLKNRSPVKRNRKNKMTKSKTKSIIEDLDLIEKGLFLETQSSDEDVDSEPKRRRKKTQKPKSLHKHATSKPQVTSVVDIRGDLLAEWDDDEESGEDKVDTSNITLDQSVNVIEQNHKEEEATINTRKDDKSCFDFDEEEEDQIVGTSVGRKIPRVIPPPDRPKSSELDILKSDLSRSENLDSPIKGPLNITCSSEDFAGLGRESESSIENLAKDESIINSPLNRDEILKIIHQVDENRDLETENDKLEDKERIQDLDLAFKDILEATTVPELPEIPHSLKFEQNFHDSKTIKFPDKIEPPPKIDTEMPAKLINPKKRFVKSFEDFEQQIHNEQKKLLQLEQLEKVPLMIHPEVRPCNDTVVDTSVTENVVNKEESVRMEGMVEVAKLKTQLKNKLENPDVEESKPKRPLLLRDRILSSHKEEMGILHEKMATDFDIIDAHIAATRELTSVTSFSQATSTLPDVLLETDYSPKKFEDVESVQTELSVIKCVEAPEVVENENVFDCSQTLEEIPVHMQLDIVNLECTKPRRLSIKMCEISETPFEIKETTHLLEVEEKVQLEPVQVLDAKETIHIVEAEQLLETETASTLQKISEELSNSMEDIEQLEPIDVVNEPTDTVKESSSIIEESANIVHESVNTVDESVNVCDESVKVVDKMANINEPAHAVKEPVDIVEEPVNIISQSVDNTVNTVDQPIGIVDELANIVNESHNIVDDATNIVNETINFEKEVVNIVEEPDNIANESVNILGEPSNVVDEPANVVGDPAEVGDEPVNVCKPGNTVELASLIQEQDTIVAEQAEIADTSSTIVDKRSDIIGEQSDIVNEQSDIVNEQSDIVHEPNNIVNDPSNNAVNEPSIVVDESTNIVDEPINVVKNVSVIEEAPQTVTTEESNPSIVTEEPVVTNVIIECTSLMPESNISFTNTTLDNQNVPEDLSALTTLATISELTTSIDINSALVSEKSKIIEDNLTSVDKSNLNFVTLDDLAERQIEISDVSASKRKSKPLNLMNFSVDFGDSNEASNEKLTLSESIGEDELNQPDSIEMSLGKVFEGETESDDSYMKSNSQLTESNMDDLDEQIPSLIVRNNSKQFLKKMKKDYSEKLRPPEYSSSSKLLEILTDGKPKSLNLESTTQTSKIIKESPSFNKIVPKPKDDKFYITKEPSSFTKHLLKNKDIFTEIPNTKTLSKSKDDKLYTISKDHTPITKASKYESKNPKFILKSSSTLKSFSPMPLSNKATKPIILSEKIIKTLSEPSETVSVQKVTSKRCTQDVEDIDTFIIQKPPKKVAVKEEEIHDPPLHIPKKAIQPRGKAKILQQTIIKPASEITQQPVGTPIDDSMFDINSMPIVLGDQILTTEGIEKMPILSEGQEPVSTVVKSNEQRVIMSNKTPTTQSVVLKTYSTQKLGKSRIYQSSPTSSTTKILKSTPAIISRQPKPDKYIILPTSTTPTTSKYTVSKKQSTSKRIAPVVLPTATITHKLQSPAISEPSGNKIMIVTNQQGQQSRVLLTPAQQKLFGYQTTTVGSKLVKSTLKGNILQKTSIKTPISPLTTASPVNKISHAIVNSQGEITTTQNIMSTEPILVPVKGTPLRPIKSDHTKPGRKFQIQQQKVSLQEGFNTLKGSLLPGQQKTIVIKNQQGQIVKKFQGTDDAFLEQQVAEQVQAIKASGTFSSLNVSNKLKPLKRSYPKKHDAQKLKLVSNTTKILKSEAIPPLAPISPKTTDSLLLTQAIIKNDSSTKTEPTQQKSLNQLIIQDALGNQTTIMEGQILALPSGETVDGQPQSYMLVTLDESGNLAPLNNEALLSLDPNLTLGGDLSNMVLQVDDAASKKAKIDTTMITAESKEVPKTIEKVTEQTKIESLPESTSKTESETLTNVDPQPNMQTVTCSIGNDPNQQLIITGDPITTQKFIESLTEGNPDLANLLASAEGNILIQTDEQQILINTDSENQVLLPINPERLESSESDSNPIFATQPMKNQDILAAALADTDVFQQEQTVSPIQSKLGQSQLSPNSGLYQAGVSNVLETTLSLSSPIMTPLEVPSTNNKKIPDEEMDILTTEVPKNVDLPITITDPNISQTVAQQQVVSLITNELTSNLDLPLTISDQVVPLTSTEMHSPSFGYPLSSLDDSVTNIDVQKSFSGPISMPLLTEDDSQVSTITKSIVEESEVPEHIIEEKSQETVAVHIEEETVIRTSKSKEAEESSSVEDRTVIKREELFESSALTDSIIKDDAKSPSKNFLGTTMESEEGLCTLGGAMCSSLSEPPPDMFDLSLVGTHFVTGPEIKNSITSGIRTDSVESSVIQKSPSVERINSSNENENGEEFNKYENYNVENVENKIDNGLLTAPSDSSSPVVNVDENSCEIPVQPQIVTDLSSSSFDSVDVSNFEATKRAGDDFNDESSDRKKLKFD